MHTALPPAKKPRAKQLATFLAGWSFRERVVIQEFVEFGYKLGKMAITETSVMNYCVWQRGGGLHKNRAITCPYWP
jgi:hypothetical protein